MKQFLRFARITESENDVAVIENSQVAMQCVDAVEKHRGSTRAGKRCCYLAPDISRLSDSNDDDFSLGGEGVDDRVDGGLKILVELAAHRFQGANFDIKNLAR